MSWSRRAEARQAGVVLADAGRDVGQPLRSPLPELRHAGGDNAAADDALAGIARHAARGRVEVVDAHDDRQVVARLGLDHQPPQPPLDPVGQLPHGSLLVGGVRRGQVVRTERASEENGRA